MPISKYYKGSGEKVMKDMKKRYGKKKGESVFYATANKRGLTGSGVFTDKEIQQGYKTCYSSNQLKQMEASEEAACYGRKQKHVAEKEDD